MTKRVAAYSLQVNERTPLDNSGFVECSSAAIALGRVGSTRLAPQAASRSMKKAARSKLRVITNFSPKNLNQGYKMRESGV